MDERAHTFRALDDARRHALRVPGFQMTRHRYIILSDTHRGDRAAGTDEFAPNEAVYCHALRHYLESDFRLVLNGDIEEGWKAAFADILRAYAETAYALEHAFARRGDGYYTRLYGNHDSEWADPRVVQRCLSPHIGRPVRVHAAVMLGDRIMITHGHQGEWHSDRYAWISRRFVRRVWTPLQRHLGLTRSQIAAHGDPPRARDRTLHDWAQSSGLLLIAGHTHRPRLTPTHGSGNTLGPHYVNDGCGVHQDGITGLEIDQGVMRLVKWGHTAGSIQRTIFEESDLAAQLARL